MRGWVANLLDVAARSGSPTGGEGSLDYPNVFSHSPIVECTTY